MCVCVFFGMSLVLLTVVLECVLSLASVGYLASTCVCVCVCVCVFYFILFLSMAVQYYHHWW